MMTTPLKPPLALAPPLLPALLPPPPYQMTFKKPSNKPWDEKFQLVEVVVVEGVEVVVEGAEVVEEPCPNLNK